MSKVLRVVRHELITTFTRSTYVFFAFIVPVLAVVIVGGVEVLRRNAAPGAPSAGGAGEDQALKMEGYVDPGGLVKVIPKDLPPGQLVAYADEAQALRALQAGEIDAYYIVPADYVERGEITYVYPDGRSLIEDGQDWIIRWTLLVNLLGGDEDAAGWVWNPIRQLDMTSLAPAAGQGPAGGDDCSRPGYACESNTLIRYLPAIMVGIFYASFAASGGLLFQSIGSEKDNRTLEVLLLSIHPRRLLAGKIVGLGIAGLLQTAAWLGAVFITFQLGGQTFSLPDEFVFPADLLAWGIVFFLGGYAIYASLMAGAGALVPKMKEAGAANLIAMLPLLAGYIVGLLAPIAGLADEALPVGMSLFPLTAPVVMIMRLTSGEVPLWQLLLSATLTYATAYLIFRSVAALFQAQTLLSGQPFSAGRYLRALIGRA